MNALQQLAEFVAQLRYEALPAQVVERAKTVLLDTLGVILGGSVEPEVAALAGYAEQTAPGSAQLLGRSGKVTPVWAVLVHGTAGTTLEMDEGHAYARGHAAIHAVPPALALAQAKGASGRDLLTGLVAGYEVAARAGTATRLRKPVHPFGAWGVLGAAATAAWFRRTSPSELAGTLELAASYTIAPSFATAYQGATVRNTYAGMVNHLGLLAADFYALGFCGEKGGLETTFGHILGQEFDAKALSDDLGTRFEIMRGYFKPYSGCRYTHAAIDAVLALLQEEAVTVEELDAVAVTTYDIAANLAETAPQTALAARFSLPYVTAATLVHGSAGPEIFTADALRDPTVLALAKRIRVRERADFTAMTPAQRPAQIELRFKNGRRREHTVYGSKGDPDQPMSAAELQQKFRRLAARALPATQVAQAWTLLNKIELLNDLNPLDEALTSANNSGAG